MEARFTFCFLLLAATAASDIQLEFDRPSLRISISDTAKLQCCYTSKDDLQVSWIQNVMVSKNESKPNTLIIDERVNIYLKKMDNSYNNNNMKCNCLDLKNVTLNDTGLYQCALNFTGTITFTPGTFLQVYKPIIKNMNVSEKVKNSIITAEGVLLLLCMLLPGSMLFCKTKSLNELQKKKDKEEENIYEGLNLEECNSTYDQIQRTEVHGPYQDVMHTMEEDIQLEKP